MITQASCRSHKGAAEVELGEKLHPGPNPKVCVALLLIPGGAVTGARRGAPNVSKTRRDKQIGPEKTCVAQKKLFGSLRSPEDMSGRGGKRVAGPGSLPARRPSNNEVLARAPKASGRVSIAGWFGGGGSSSSAAGDDGSSSAQVAASESTTVGSVRAREPGGTPKKEDSTRSTSRPLCDAGSRMATSTLS